MRCAIQERMYQYAILEKTFNFFHSCPLSKTVRENDGIQGHLLAQSVMPLYMFNTSSRPDAVCFASEVSTAVTITFLLVATPWSINSAPELGVQDKYLMHYETQIEWIKNVLEFFLLIKIKHYLCEVCLKIRSEMGRNTRIFTVRPMEKVQKYCTYP
jgi:hypothetical protein